MGFFNIPMGGYINDHKCYLCILSTHSYPKRTWVKGCFPCITFVSHGDTSFPELIETIMQVNSFVAIAGRKMIPLMSFMVILRVGSSSQKIPPAGFCIENSQGTT